MEYNFKNDFRVLYENDFTSNYLILKTSKEKEIINYQAQMLLHNKLNGLLDFNINRIGDEINCFYNITSKCTLASFMSRKHFKRDEFLKVILNVINNIYQLKNYLLNDDSILLDENFIYVEPDSINIYFVYLPFSDCKSDIKAFFTKFIFQLAKFNDEYSDNYIQRLLEAIKSENFSLCNLKNLVESLLSEDIKNHKNLIEDFGNTIDNIETNNIQTAKSLKVEKAKNKILKASKTDDNQTSLSKRNFKIPHSQDIKKQENIISNKAIKAHTYNLDKDSDIAPNINDKEKNKKKNKFLIALILLQPFLILSFVLLINSEFVKLSDSPKTTVIILILIFLAVDILIIRMLNEKIQKVYNSPLITICKKMEQSDNYTQLQTIPKAIESKTAHSDENNLIKNEIKEEQLNKVNRNYNGETVIIKKTELTGKPFLKAKDGEEIIEINKNSILIGRMENFVDYLISNSAIGKVHAEILQEGEEFYVVDCNSKNGTFLNDNRIPPNTKKVIKNNDILRFANTEFVFSYSETAEIDNLNEYEVPKVQNDNII